MEFGLLILLIFIMALILAICEHPYTEDALEIARIDWAILFVHLRECCGVTLTDDINRFVYDEDALHGKTKSFVNCNVLFERIGE